jgi:SOS response regulatory protein OraA/RecX
MARKMSPAEIEEAIAASGDLLEDSVDVIDELQEAFLLADAELDRAFARAYLNHQGPQQEKRYAAELATEKERTARDQAFLIFKYAERKANAVDRRISGLQTRSKSANNAMNTYGGR